MAVEIQDEILCLVQSYVDTDLRSDKELANKVQEATSLGITDRQIRRLRSSHGILLRYAPQSEDFHIRQVKTYDTVKEVIQGPGKSMGARWMWLWLRRCHSLYNVRRDVAAAQKALDEDGVSSRIPGKKHRRKEGYITAGPNFIWSTDGHDKLSAYGFKIYGAVDAYSRKVLWIYCGNANRSQFAVAKQYVDTVKSTGFYPRFLRFDHGAEVVIMATIQYELYISNAIPIGAPPDEVLTSKCTDCVIWGPSTSNQRIESLWRRLGDETTRKCTALFAFMTRTGNWMDTLIADQVFLLFVFMPLLRVELYDFMLTKNDYPMRKDEEHTYHVRGVPDELYSHHSIEQRFPVDRGFLQAWEDQLSQLSKSNPREKAVYT